MTASVAIVPTKNASRYLQQLCKHWGHRFEVQFDTQHGHVTLPLGNAVLVASDETLTVECEVSPGNDIAKLQSVIVEHLNRFAFREGELVFDWHER